jgi:hypothetical protein
MVNVTLLRNNLPHSNRPLALSRMQQDQDKGPEIVCRGGSTANVREISVVRIR